MNLISYYYGSRQSGFENTVRKAEVRCGGSET